VTGKTSASTVIPGKGKPSSLDSVNYAMWQTSTVFPCLKGGTEICSTFQFPPHFKAYFMSLFARNLLERGQELPRGLWRLYLTLEDRLDRSAFSVQIVVCVLIEIDLRTLKISSRISSA
jgi:hypothetical protein